MKARLLKNILSVLMVVCLLFGIMPSTAFADNGATSKGDLMIENIIAGTVSVDDVYGTLDADTVPEIIGYDYAVSRTHIQRLYAEEGSDLNRIVFLNADGSQTAYIFDYPVKYIDEMGAVKDITLDIATSKVNGQFETAAGNSVTTFSRNINDGISLVGNDETITLVPHLPASSTARALSATTQGKKSSIAQRIDTKTVCYTYDSKTTIEYSLTYTGFKEDIVVSEYTGQTKYDFTLYTNGLKLVEIDDSFCLIDETNTVKAMLGDIIIFTANDKNNTMGDMVSKTVVENQEYILTIIIDPDFLSDEETVYPIRIDPTVEICYDNNGVGAISDVTINSNSGSSATSGSLSVGLRETYGISRILMKFPGLNLCSLGNDIKISNASVEIRDLLCEGTELEVSCYVFSGNEWNESTVNWSNVSPNSISTFLSSNVISYANGKKQETPHRYVFDITKAVEGWRIGNYSANKGIIFKGSASIENGTTYNCKTIASYNRSSYKPSLSVTYSTNSNLISEDTYYLNNRYCGDYLRYASSAASASSGLLSTLGDSICWEIKAVDGGYAIRSKSDITKYLGVPTSTSSSSVSIVTVSDSIIPKRCVWSISIADGGGCIVKNNYNLRYLYSYGNSVYTHTSIGTSGTSTYDSRVWRIISQTNMLGKEMTQDSNFGTLFINVGSTASPTITTNPTNAIWATTKDFTYSRQVSTYVNVSDGVFTGNSPGMTTVIATHKVTDRKFVFAVIVGAQPTFAIRNYVDQGYRIRFSGYSNVQTYDLVVSEKFEQFFGLNVTSVCILHTSAADICKINKYGSVTSDNLASSCTHSSTHLTKTALRDVMGNGTNVNSKILWTGHILTGNPSSDASSTRYSVVITPKYTTTGSTYTNMSNSEVRKQSIYTLMHELSHQLGAPDHYCYGIAEGETVCRNKNCDICYMGRTTIRSCMMSFRCDIENSSEATLYCSSCLADINAHISDHHQ